MSKEPKYKVWKRRKQRKPDRGGMTMAEAGRKGAQATNRQHTLEEHQAWGHKGGSTTLARYGPDFYRKIQKRSTKASEKKRPKPQHSQDGMFVRRKARAKSDPPKPEAGCT